MKKSSKSNALSNPPLKTRGGRGSYGQKKIAYKRELARIRQQRHRAKLAASPDSRLDSSGAQLRQGAPQGQMTSWFQDYIFRKIDGNFYETLREGIPIFDAAIRRIISLNGTIRIIGDNLAIVKELEDFTLNVPVNDMQKGIHAFKENAENETLEQGFSISEFVSNKKRDDIERLIVADSKQIFFRRNIEGKAEPWYRSGVPAVSNYTMPGTIINQILNARYGQTVSYNGVDETKLNPDNKIYFSINNENQDPHGVSIFRSTEFVAQVLVTVQNSIKNLSERFGDPSFHVHYKGKAGDVKIKDRKDQMEKDFKTVITAKRAGQSGDFFTAGGPDSEVNVKVIGIEGQVMTFDIPLRHLLEQIVAKTGLPAWMLGIYWSTTERMATLEIETALADAKIRQFAMLPEYIRLFSNLLRLRGRTWDAITTSLDKPGDWGIIFESPNVRDLVAQAQARFLNAQADLMSSGGAGSQTTLNIGGGASVEIDGMKFPLITPHQSSPLRGEGRGEGTCLHCGKIHKGEKELSRPTPWPELDKVEQEYETNLKNKWEELKQKTFTILGLQDKSYMSHTTDFVGAGLKPAPTSIESFTFSDEQRQAIMNALDNFIGYYDWKDTDSAVRWSYAQSYSLGLIRAAKLIGKERPILDIIKNQDIFEELIKNGFQLVKDNATSLIKDGIIAEMETQMLAGTNPRLVADRLERLFGDQNSDWERLARTEMSSAAERAKLDEWAEWDIKKVKFSPAPDACPFCFSLAGDYEIGACPIPGTGTHPRCRCSITLG